jgi:hypothetical protein
MPSVEIGKYTRPGIYVEEFDRSIIETPTVTGLQTLVIGSSKKGPLNTPVVLNSQTDLENIFGEIDRSLESKGSYFHRTISKVLQNSPVVAMNIIDLDDDLDLLKYKSLSTSSGYTNDIERSESYRRFFDTSTFWKKDRDAFLSVTSEDPLDNQRILHFTNFADREITVFIVKSQNTAGFERTLLEWYGSVDKVPLYVDSKDYASDYLVDVVVVGGNWTNYSNLAVDPKWSKYFNTSGLIKTTLFDFANDTNVNTLRVWRNLSLIPYFRDGNGANIFIENRINQDTDETGLYCAFNIDAVESDFRNGLIDIIGNSLINSNTAESINFLSYEEDITEVNNYPQVDLDTPGNVYQMTYDNYYQSDTQERRAIFAEGYIGGLVGPTSSEIDGSYPSDVGYGTYSFDFVASTYTVNSVDYEPYAVIGGATVSLDTTTFSYHPDDFVTSSTNPGTTQSFTKVIFIDTDGSIKDNPTNTQLADGIVLGYANIIVALDNSREKYFQSVDYTPVSVDGSGFVYFDTAGVTYSIDVNETEITYEFLDTTGTADVTDYVNYRKWRVYNQFVSVLNSTNANRATILVDEGSGSEGNPWKKSIADLNITINSSSSSNKTITFGGFDTGELNGTILASSGIILHTTDNELVLSSNGAVTTDNWKGSTYGVVGIYSDLYQDYNDGLINTGDYFYENLIDGADNTLESIPTYIQFLDVNGNDYIVFDQEINFTTNEVIKVPESTLNTGELTVSNPSPVSVGLTGASGTYYGYLVAENVTAETITNPTKVWSVTQKHYVRFYKTGDVLTMEFMDSGLTSLSTTFNSQIDIISQDSNFRQTVEIEEPSGYTVISNKILVEATRYTEVKIGDFLEAEVDESNLEIGEIPRRVTRILSKKLYSGDSTLVEITCDSPIKKYSFNGDKQTYRFSSIDDYVSTYKGISLYGFRTRTDSLPNGTDSRLSDILQIIGKGTPLYNALTDKDIIDFRYLVDSYGLGLTELSKQELVDICGKRLDCFGIINMPSIKQFRNSSSPTFVDNEGRLDTNFIKLGGDPESSPAFNYSFGEGDGVTCVGYFTPYVVVNDNGRPREVPPAAWVATTFLRKHNNAIPSVTPWTVAAGITDGQVTGIAGLEYDFNSQDISNLNQMKANPIVSKRNRGRVIETENTAQTLVTSALSFIHVREVLIELERELSDMLLNFQWKYNTPEIRAEIKLRADAICADFLNRNGLYNFFNKIDAENNTQEIIDNQLGILDTYVEPIKAMGVIVNNITILRTGAINSGGFL